MKKILWIIVLSFLVSSCAEDLATNKINGEKISFTKGKKTQTVGSYLKFNKFKEKCKKNKDYHFFTSCLTHKMQDRSIIKNKKNYLFEVYNLKEITTVHQKLVDLNYFSEKEAFSRLEKIINLELSQSSQRTFEDDLQLNQNCEKNKKFIDFIDCLDRNIRNQEVYLNANFSTRSIIERIIGYSILYAKNEQIYLSNFSYDRNYNDEKDAYKFLNQIVDYYAESYHKEIYDRQIASKSRVSIPGNATLKFYKDGMYYFQVPGEKNYIISKKDTRNHLLNEIKTSLTNLKKEDLRNLKSEIGDEIKNLDVIDVAFFISTVYLITQGDTPIQKILSDNETSAVSTKSITQSGKSSSVLSANNTSIYRKNMFRYVPKSSVLNKPWFKYGLLRGRF